MRTWEIYNRDYAIVVGSYRAPTKRQALDAMAHDYGCRDYDELAREEGVDRTTALSSLEITVY